MKFKALVFIRLRSQVDDSPGNAVRDACKRLSELEIKKLRLGKVIDINPVFAQLSEQRGGDLSVTFCQHLAGLGINDVLRPPPTLAVSLGYRPHRYLCII